MVPYPGIFFQSHEMSPTWCIGIPIHYRSAEKIMTRELAKAKIFAQSTFVKYPFCVLERVRRKINQKLSLSIWVLTGSHVDFVDVNFVSTARKKANQTK
jgi:hypothetical protein